MIKDKNVMWAAPLMTALVLSMMAGPALADVPPPPVTNDQWFTFGQNNWGEKNAPCSGMDDGGNCYTGTLGTYFYCKTNGGSVKAGCASGLIDTRTNWVRHAVQMNGGKTLAYELSLQGCDPWGNYDGPPAPSGCTTSRGAAVHNTNFPRSPIAPVGSAYKLQGQFAWFTDSFYADSKPNTGIATGAEHANLITDLWFKSQPGVSPSSIVVIDFSWAYLRNNNGHWEKDPNVSVGGQYSAPYRELDGSGRCIYHYNVVLDNNSAANTWRATGLIGINGYIANAFSPLTSYTGYGKEGTCSTTVPSGNTYTTSYALIDMETGSEIFTSSASPSVSGTLVDAYSQSLLTW